MRSEEAYELVTTGEAEASTFPARWFDRLLRALPGVHDLLVTVACETSRRLNTSPGAPGPHAFAVRTCAIRLADTRASIASRPTIVTTRSPLFIEAGRAHQCIDFPKNGSKIFFPKRLDRIPV